MSYVGRNAFTAPSLRHLLDNMEPVSDEQGKIFYQDISVAEVHY